MTTTQDIDPFAGADKVPAVSWADAPVGTVVKGVVVEAPKLVQSRDYKTGEPATWPDGNPKMSVVIRLDINGEQRSLWAAKPSAMFAALAKAQTDAGARITVGGELAVKYTGDKQHENPRFNPAKQYQARYTPPAASDDPWAADAATSSAQPVAAAPTGDDEPPF
jgi:hypothetical protein